MTARLRSRVLRDLHHRDHWICVLLSSASTSTENSPLGVAQRQHRARYLSAIREYLEGLQCNRAYDFHFAVGLYE